MKLIIGLAIFLCSSSFAAQLGKVIVDTANVLEYPKAGSKVISTVKRNAVLQVSNLATEGFYKSRLPSGDVGWISGNDVFVLPAGSPAEVGAPPGEAPLRKKESESKKEDPDEFWGDGTRIQVGYGLKYTVYGGLSDYFTSVDGLNYGQTIKIELQRKWFYLLYWALRVELNTAQTGDQQLNATTVQRIKEFSVPIQLGVLFHPIHARKFRLGFGVYGGASVANYTEVEQEVSSVSNTVRYSSMDPLGSGVVQVTYGLTKALGIYGEFDYRYHVTGEQNSTTVLGPIPGFQIDYSSYLVRFGLELRL